MNKNGLMENDLADAAALAGCELSVMKALVDVSGVPEGFLPDCQPVIVFHGELFSRKTLGVYDSIAPDISYPDERNPDPVAEQHDLLHKAMLLNDDAALKATSWGRFQILGHNFALAGFRSLQDFVSAMYLNEAEQLMSFVRYLKNLFLTEDLRKKDWAAFAGKLKSAEEAPGYAKQLASAYSRYAQ